MQMPLIPVPNLGTPFRLTLSTSPDPLLMLRGSVAQSEFWQYDGAQKVVGTEMFVLVSTPGMANLEAVRNKLKPENIPEALWIEAFSKAYPTADSSYFISVPHAPYTDEMSHRRYPVLGGTKDRPWSLDFFFAKNHCSIAFRWMIKYSPANWKPQDEFRYKGR